MPAPDTTARYALAAVLLLAVPLTGCIGSDDEIDAAGNTGASEAPPPLFTSFDEAMSAANATFDAEEDDATVRLALIDPGNPANVSVAKQNVTVVLFDGSDRTPVEDANVTLDAIMPAMGHGTSPEANPVHRGHGVYQGLTNIMMKGGWILELDAELPDGTHASWAIELKAGGIGGSQPNTEPVHHRFETTFEETVTGLDHAKTWTFPVNASGAAVHLNLSLTDASPADELTVALVDANGTELVSKTLTSDAPTANLTAASAPNAGDYTLDVTGRALETTYTADVTVVWVTMEPAGKDDSGEHGDHAHHGH